MHRADTNRSLPSAAKWILLSGQRELFPESKTQIDYPHELSRTHHDGLKHFRMRILEFCFLCEALICLPPLFAATATTTTLTVSSSSMTSGTALTLTAMVAAGGSQVHPGVVYFCDTSYAKCAYQAVVGKAQLTNSGTASIKIVPSISTHGYRAWFLGTKTYTKSISSQQTVDVTGTYPTTTTISSSGSAGNYALIGTVVLSGSKTIVPSGTVTFEDISNNNYSLGSATLGSGSFNESAVNPGSSGSVAVPRELAIADFNSDGIPDLAIASQYSGCVVVLLGIGSGTFTPAGGSPICGLGSLMVGVTAGDFNNDGNVDLALTDYTGGSVVILLGNGDGSFRTPTTVSLVGGPEVIRAADFNNDGNLDLVVAQQNSNQVTVLFGDGTGAFLSSSSFGTGSQPYSIAVADLNNDGNLDMVVGNRTQNTVTVLLGNGSGSFSQATGSPFNAGTNPANDDSLAIGDFNGDGNPDLAVADQGNTTIAILLGNGDGTFGAPTYLTAPGGIKTLTMGDFNGDGNLDLATCANSSGAIDVYLGNGNGTFSGPTAFWSGATGCSDSVSADLNGDGVPDLVVPLQGNNTALVLLNSMQYTATTALGAVSIPGAGTHNIAAAYGGDSNSAASISETTPLTASKAMTTLSLQGIPSTAQYDQLVALIATLSPYTAGSLSTNGETVTFNRNGEAIGTANLSAGVATLNTMALSTGTNSLTAVFPADTSFLASTSSTVNYTITKATPTITWATPSPIAYGTALSATQLNAASGGVPGTFVYTPAAGAVPSTGPHTLSVTFTPTDTTDFTTATASVTLTVDSVVPTTTLNLSANTLAHSQALTLTATVVAGATPIYPGTVTFCDTSYSKCLYEAVVGIAQLNSSGIAVVKIVPGIGAHSFKAAFAGNPDYAAATSSSQSVIVTGTFSTTSTISSSGSAGAYTLTDTVVSSGNKIVSPSGTVAFRDTANGNYTAASATLGSSAVTQTFASASSSSSIANSRDVAVADFNGDGIPDVAVVNQSGSSVYILLGSGDGTFTGASGSPVSISGGNNLVGIAAGDFNNDGYVDLAVVSWGGSKVFILLGNGNGTFQTPTSISVVGSPVEIATADFNNDGNLDLAVVDNSGNHVEVLLGNGAGAFPATSTYSTGSSPYSIAVADLNNDGNLDMAIGNNGANSVTVLLGDGAGSFSQPTGSPFAAGTNPSPSALVIGDFNGDGKPDLAVPDSGNSTIGILLGNGDGTFGTASYLTALSGQKTIAMADFNGDGNQDLAVCDLTSGTIEKYLGNGNGSFQSAVSISTGSTTCSDMASADFNRDGNPDLVIPMHGNNKAVILLDSMTHTASASATAVSIPGSGTHNIVAVYSGDNYDASSTSSATPLTASTVSTTLTIQPTPTSSIFGQQVTLTVALSPFAAGSLTTDGEAITFKNGGTTIGTGILAGGAATLNISSLAASTNGLTAVFAGDTNFLAGTSPTVNYIVTKATPAILWATPTAITYGTVLSATQLNATSSGIAGTLIYNPVAGTELGAGSQTLSVTFTPTDTSDYNTTNGSVTLTVNKATPTLSVATSGTPSTYGTSVTFTATISSGPTGTVTFYDSGAPIGTGTIGGTTASFSTTALTAGFHTITAGWTGNSNYNPILSGGITQAVSRATPTIGWPTPSPITQGMALSSTQLDASSGGVAGSFVYSPAAGTVLGAGSQTLSVAFTPTDTADYNSANGSVTLTVDNKTTPVITWTTPVPISYGTVLNSTQLNASSGGVAGTLVYFPAAGTVPGAGAQTLQVTFTPADTTTYNAVIQTVTLAVNKSPVVITGTSSLIPSVYGDRVTATFTFAGAGVTPTGTANISDGETTLATVSISAGVASYHSSQLSAGIHNLKAVYNGDDNYE